MWAGQASGGAGHRKWLMLLMLALAVGCGDSELTRTSQTGDTTSTTGDTSGDTAGTTGGTTPSDTSDPIPEDGCCVMVPAGGETTLMVEKFSVLNMGVLLYSRQSGEPVSEETIEYEIEAGGDAQLSVRSVVTDSSGRGLIQFVAGEELRSYEVTARHPGANSVTFTVEVGDVPKGNLRLTYVNSGESVYTVGPIEAFVFPRSQFVCNNFRPQASLPDTEYMDEVRTAGGSSTFNDLSVAEPWTVVAFGRGEYGQIAAAGCVGNVYLQENQTLETEVVLTLLALNPVGRYNVISNWDFTETLQDAGTVGQIILQIRDAAENPGRYLYDQLINVIQQFLGGLISGAVEFFLDVFGLDDQIEDGINSFIDSIDFISRIRQALIDLTDVVTNLEVISTLTVGKLGSDYEITGTDDWYGLAVYWRWNCGPNDPPECGRIELALDPDSDIGLVFGEWRGQVSAYNQLRIYPHSVNLRYGRLIVYILNEVIIPTLTNDNAHSMTEAILYWVNCNGLAESITGSDREICAPLDIVCIEADDIADVCDSTIRFLFGFAETLLNDLEVGSVLEMSGEGKLVERDGDLLVDEIIEGTYTGTVNLDDTRSPFSATWSATREQLDGVDE